MRGDFDDETEIARLRRQGCVVEAVETDQIEAFTPYLLGAVRRANAPRT